MSKTKIVFVPKSEEPRITSQVFQSEMKTWGWRVFVNGKLVKTGPFCFSEEQATRKAKRAIRDVKTVLEAVG